MGEKLDLLGHPRYACEIESFAADLLADALNRSGLDEGEFLRQVAALVGFDIQPGHLQAWLQGAAVPPGRVLVAALRLTGTSVPSLAPLDTELLIALAHGRPSTPGSGTQLRTKDLVAWLADHSDVTFTTLWTAVAEAVARLQRTPPAEKAATERRRAHIAREQMAAVLAEWYGSPPGLYRVRVGASELLLTILSNPEWTGLAIPLGTEAEHAICTSAEEDELRVTGAGLDAAVRRLATAEAADTVMVDDLLYRLRSVALANDRMDASFSLIDFAAFALTNDLLEDELIDSLIAGTVELPLRRLYLPSSDSALDFSRRNCVGGPVCLTAIARPVGDYALLVQQRSARVLNVTGRLAVIPKAFHQPMVDVGGEARVSATVEREFEEELLGRLDLDVLTSGAVRKVAPLHRLGSSEPAVWLRSHPGSWHLECTAFGINLVNGNYEFACLLAIDDDSWWGSFGHLVEANWEAARLRCWSSKDNESIESLIADPRWSNEGLFAFVEGLRRLSVIAPERMATSRIEAVVR